MMTLDAHVIYSTIDFSFPVLLWNMTGTVKEFQTSYVRLYPTTVDPSDGSFVGTVQFYLRFVISSGSRETQH